jgi:hypothetical protein
MLAEFDAALAAPRPAPPADDERDRVRAAMEKCREIALAHVQPLSAYGLASEREYDVGRNQTAELIADEIGRALSTVNLAGVDDYHVRPAPPAEGRALRFDTEEAATALAAHLEYRVMPDESWDHVARSALAWFQESVRFAPDTHAGVSIVYAPARPPAARAERGHPSPPAGDEGGRG